MSCRNLDYKLDELRRCGCDRCHNEYNELRYGRRYDDRYRQEMGRITRVDALIPMVYTKDLKVTETPAPKVEEPKNMAVKLLVDKLKYEQSLLTGHQANIEIYKKSLNDHNSKKVSTQKNIKELAAALKKLGHKEAK